MNTTGTRRWWALGALTLAVLAVGLDGTVLSVALPTLAGRATCHRVRSPVVLLRLSAGARGGDAAGGAARRPLRPQEGDAGLAGPFRRRLGGLRLRADAGAFIAARLVLGLAGAGIIVMSLSALTVLFSEAERPRAVGVWAAANFLALPIGPILGGWLLTHYWWGWVFLINVPVALVGLLAALALVPESRAPERPGLDPVGVSPRRRAWSADLRADRGGPQRLGRRRARWSPMIAGVRAAGRLLPLGVPAQPGGPAASR